MMRTSADQQSTRSLWFEQQEQGEQGGQQQQQQLAMISPELLSSNRAIRGFLQQYPRQLWPQVLNLALIHGVVAVQTAFPGEALTPGQLRALAEQGAAAGVVARKLPALQRELLELQASLDGVYDDISGAAAGDRGGGAGGGVPRGAPGGAAAAAARRAVVQQQQQANNAAAQRQLPLLGGGADHDADAPQQRGRDGARAGAPPRQRRKSPVIIAPKPSSEWRDGAPTGFPSPARRRRRPLSPMRRSMGERERETDRV